MPSAAQVIHQRDHLPVRWPPPATPSAACGPGGFPAPGCTPSRPLGHIDRGRVRSRPRTLSSATSAPSPPSPAATPADRPPRRPSSVSFFFPAAIAASLPSHASRNEAARGAAREIAESDRRARSDSTPARMIAPSARLSSGHEAPRIKRRHGQHAAIMPTAAPARHPFPTRRTPMLPAGHHRHHPAPWKPVTAPAGARAAHLSPATPARDHPQQPPGPSFAGTPRRQTH